MGVTSWQWQHFAANFFAVIGAAAVRSIVLAAAAGLLLAVLRVKNVAQRLATWKLVLWGALAMPLLVWLLPPVPFALPGTLAAPFARFLPASQATPGTDATEGITSAAAESEFTVEAAPAVRASSLEHAAQPAESAVMRVRRAPASKNRAAQTAQAAASMSTASTSSSYKISQPAATSALPAPGHASSRPRVSAAAIATVAYFAMVALLLSRLVIGWMLGRRLIRTSCPIRDHRATLSLSLRAFPGHIEEPPLLAESEAVSVPVTLGVARPVILLPADWREWDDHKLNAVLAHELSHIGRNDALTQRVSQLHRAMYWFSPLAWWLDREIARLAEEASDEAALASGADREQYAETLLGFFEAVRAASGRVWWQGVSMAARGDAAERVDRILSWKGAVSMRVQKTFVVALAAIALPALFATASVHFTARADQATPAAAAAPASAPAPASVPAFATAATPVAAPAASPTDAQEPSPAPAPQPAPAPAPPQEPDSLPPSSVHAPARPSRPIIIHVPAVPEVHVEPFAFTGPEVRVAPLPPMNVVVPAMPRVQVQGLARLSPLAGVQGFALQSGHPGNATFWVSDEEHVRDPYIISAGGQYIGVLNHSVFVDTDGDSDDLYWAKRLRSKIGGDFIWFEHDGKGYVVRDRTTIDRAVALYKPIRELSAQQEELGKQQEALGEQQEALGQQMEEVTVKIPDMSADLDRIKERMRELAAKGGTQSDIGDLQGELGELQSRIGEIQSQAGREESKIGRQQGELGRKQGELGRKQGELGRQEGQLSRKAEQQMESIIDEARTKNLAQPE